MRFLDDFVKISKSFGLHQALKQVFLPRVLAKLYICDYFRLYDIAIRTFLSKNFFNIVLSYKNRKTDAFLEKIPNIIWVIWWQGEEKMPKVIRECYMSIKRNSAGRKVILITEHNYNDYITIPKYILNKVRKGIISLTHFSDVIRVSLLSKFGGLYIDCGIFVTKPIFLGDVSFFSTKVVPANDKNVANQNKWVIGLIGATKGDVVVEYIRDMLYEYWKCFDIEIDYLMFDFILKLGYDNIEAIHNEIDHVEYNSPNIHESRYLFNKEVDKDKLMYLVTNNTFLSLTYRIKYPLLVNGQHSYYFELLKIYGRANN